MGLAELFQDLADQALTPGGYFDNVPRAFSFYSAEDGNATTYDPLTGEAVRNESAPISITGVIVNPKLSEVDNESVQRDDRFLLVSGNNFRRTGLSVRRKPGDRIVDANGTSWEVVGDVATDPVDALFTFHLRRP